MLLQTILHGFRAIALLFALASRARMLPHVKNEEHAMSIHTMKAPVLVSNGMHFRVTFCAAAHARHASPTIPVRQGMVSRAPAALQVDRQRHDGSRPNDSFSAIPLPE